MLKNNSKLVQIRAGKDGENCEYLDLSNSKLGKIEPLDAFSKLQALVACNNSLYYVGGLESCFNLWFIDLSNNSIDNIGGLRPFIALGKLNLSGNCLPWRELSNIQHMAIVDLVLNGNPELEAHPWYRVHVVDCLPYAWMLDGKFVTSVERMKTVQFFEDSALTKRPIRHKLPRNVFMTTEMRLRHTCGSFGKVAHHMLGKFPLHVPFNEDVDHRRLAYLCTTIENELALESRNRRAKYAVVVQNPDFLSQLVELKQSEPLMFNVLVILLLASVQFRIPSLLVRQFLARVKLLRVGRGIVVSDILRLPRNVQRSVLSGLFGSMKLDRDHGYDAKLHDMLYLAIYFTLTGLYSKAKHHTSTDREMRRLLAMEAVHLLAFCPSLYTAVGKHPDVTQLIATATSNELVVRLTQLMSSVSGDNKMDVEQSLTEHCEAGFNMLSGDLRPRITQFYNNTTNLTAQQIYILTTKNAVPKKPMQWVMYACEFHTRGIPSPLRPGHDMATSMETDPRFPQCASACIGDRVMIGPQMIGYIISLPETNVAQIQMPLVPTKNGNMVVNVNHLEQHYTYIDLSKFVLDCKMGVWRPRDSTGDRVTLTGHADSFISADDNKCGQNSILPMDFRTTVTAPTCEEVDLSLHNVTAEDLHTVSVAVAFTTSRSLKLTFSANSDENWIEWKTPPVINASAHGRQQAVMYAVEAGSIWPLSSRARRHVPNCQAIRDALGLKESSNFESSSDRDNRVPTDIVSEDSTGPTLAECTSPDAVVSNRTTDVPQPSPSSVTEGKLRETAGAAVDPVSGLRKPVVTWSNVHIFANFPHAVEMLQDINTNNVPSSDSSSSKPRSARGNVSFKLPNPLETVDHFRMVTTTTGDVYIAEKRKPPCVQYTSRGNEAICPLDELPAPPASMSCCRSVPRSSVPRRYPPASSRTHSAGRKW